MEDEGVALFLLLLPFFDFWLPLRAIWVGRRTLDAFPRRSSILRRWRLTFRDWSATAGQWWVHFIFCRAIYVCLSVRLSVCLYLSVCRIDFLCMFVWLFVCLSLTYRRPHLLKSEGLHFQPNSSHSAKFNIFISGISWISGISSHSSHPSTLL